MTSARRRICWVLPQERRRICWVSPQERRRICWALPQERQRGHQIRVSVEAETAVVEGQMPGLRDGFPELRGVFHHHQCAKLVQDGALQFLSGLRRRSQSSHPHLRIVGIILVYLLIAPLRSAEKRFQVDGRFSALRKRRRNAYGGGDYRTAARGFRATLRIRPKSNRRSSSFLHLYQPSPPAHLVPQRFLPLRRERVHDAATERSVRLLLLNGALRRRVEERPIRVPQQCVREPRVPHRHLLDLFADLVQCNVSPPVDAATPRRLPLPPLVSLPHHALHPHRVGVFLHEILRQQRDQIDLDVQR